MKKILLIVLLITTITGCSLAQPPAPSLTPEASRGNYDIPAEEIPNLLEDFVFDESCIATYTDNGNLVNYYDRQGRTVKRQRHSVSDGRHYATQYYIYNEDGSCIEKMEVGPACSQLDYDPAGLFKDLTVIPPDGIIVYTVYDAKGQTKEKYKYIYDMVYNGQTGKEQQMWMLKVFVTVQTNDKGQRTETRNYDIFGKLQEREIWQYDRQGREILNSTYSGEGNLKTEKLTRWYDIEGVHRPQTETFTTYYSPDIYTTVKKYYSHKQQIYNYTTYLLSKEELYQNGRLSQEKIYTYRPDNIEVKNYDDYGNLIEK